MDDADIYLQARNPETSLHRHAKQRLIDLLDTGYTGQSHRSAQLSLQNIANILNTTLPVESKPPKHWASDKNQVSPQSQGLENVTATRDSAVQNDWDPSGNNLHNLG